MSIDVNECRSAHPVGTPGGTPKRTTLSDLMPVGASSSPSVPVRRRGMASAFCRIGRHERRQLLDGPGQVVQSAVPVPGGQQWRRVSGEFL
jgi:hypothetical protein